MQTHKTLLARSNLRAVNAAVLPTRHALLAHQARGDIDAIPAERRQLVMAKARVCEYLLRCEEHGVSISRTFGNLLLKIELDELSAHERLIAEALNDVAVMDRKMPGRSSVFDWVNKYRNGGAAALISGHWNRERRTQGWEAKALAIYSAPGKPSMAAVTRDLRRLHGFDCSVDQVRDYLKALPVHLGERSAARIGKHLFKQVEAPYVRRSTEDLLPGDIYMADGYRADVYLAHPVTGDIWRPEVMHVIDIKTRVLVGYRPMANEGSYDVMIGWAEIFARHDHVPPLVYVDNGAGYANLMATDEMSGYYRRAGVQNLIRSLPKNAKGKGNIERYHRVVRDDFLKTWRPDFYCGPDMAKDALDATTRAIKAGHLKPPSLAEFMADYDAWLADDYHQRKSPDDKTLTRAQAFALLTPFRPHASAQEIARPCLERVVQRAAVRLHNREYKHPDLIGWNHRKVLVEFDIFKHGTVTVREMDGHLICDAPLVKAIGMVSDSFMQDARNKALAASVNRDERRLAETKARAGRVIDAEAVAQGALPALDGEARLIGHDDEDDDTPLILDLTDID